MTRVYVLGLFLVALGVGCSTEGHFGEPWVFWVRNWRPNTGSPAPVCSNVHVDGLPDDVLISNVRGKSVGTGVDRPVATVHVEHL